MFKILGRLLLSFFFLGGGGMQIGVLKRHNVHLYIYCVTTTPNYSKISKQFIKKTTSL